MVLSVFFLGGFEENVDVGDEMIQVVGGEVFRDKKDLPPKN